MLVFLRLLSTALATAFGLFGLLTEFKDEHKRITKSGKIALLGILASFVLSAAITVLEYRESKRKADLDANAEKSRILKEDERAARIKSLAHPLNEFQIETNYFLEGFAVLAWEKQLKAFLSNNRDWSKELPPRLYQKVSSLSDTGSRAIAIYRKGLQCSRDITAKPDLIVSLPDIAPVRKEDKRDAQEWFVYRAPSKDDAEHDGDVRVWRRSNAEIVYSSNTITSLDDIPGAMFVHFLPNDIPRPSYRFEHGMLQAARGIAWSIERPVKFDRVNALTADGDPAVFLDVDCYVFPESRF